MIIHRSLKDAAHPFTRISNKAVRDSRLSLTARGLLALILSMDDSWDLSIEGMVRLLGMNGEGETGVRRKDGETRVRGAWHELMAAGYIRKLPRERKPSGTLMSVEYEVTEEPLDEPVSPHPGLPHVGLPHVDQPHVVNRGQRTINPKHDLSYETIKVEMDDSISTNTFYEDKTGSQPEPAGTIAGHPLSAYETAIDAAMAKNVALIRTRYWPQLDELVHRHKSFDDTFGQNPHIAWTREEEKYLREIVQFCVQQWPDLDPVDRTAQLIRGAFRNQGKAFQFLKYWKEHGSCRLGLRPYLVLAGGQHDPTKRQDILLEIASSMEEGGVPA